MDKLKNILEIIIEPSDEYSDFDPYEEIDKYKSDDYNVKLKLPKTMIKYKGYRFFDDVSNDKFFMVLPDRDYIIGVIKYYTFDLSKKSKYNMIAYRIDVSMIHKRFRGEGLGKLMYECFINKKRIVISDDTLTEVSYHLWKDLLPKLFPNGRLYNFLYDVDVEDDTAKMSNIILSTYMVDEENIDNFIFFVNKNDVPKELIK